MNITLHGAAYIAVAFCTFWGGASILVGVQEWLSDRFTRSGWRIHRRWDRPGAWVCILPGDREGCIEAVWRDRLAGDMALMIFPDADPEWIPVMSLAPYPQIAQVTA